MNEKKRRDTLNSSFIILHSSFQKGLL